jgi:hypothetical protein
MKRAIMKGMALLLAATMITGCATLGGKRGNSKWAAVECAIVGAALATAVCLAAGAAGGMSKGEKGKVDGAEICAAAVAGATLLAAGACYTFAQRYEKRRQELAGKENDLDARLKYVRGLNTDSENINRELNTRIKEISKRTDKTVAQIERGSISRKELAKEREALLEEEKAAREYVELEKAALEDMKRFQAGQIRKTDSDRALHAQLDAEIRKQERLLEETQRATSAFAAQRQRI